MSYGYGRELIEQNKLGNENSVGIRLGRVCIEHNIPVAEVAHKLKVSRQTIYNWFVGVTDPRTVLVARLERFIAKVK